MDLAQHKTGVLLCCGGLPDACLLVHVELIGSHGSVRTHADTSVTRETRFRSQDVPHSAISAKLFRLLRRVAGVRHILTPESRLPRD